MIKVDVPEGESGPWKVNRFEIKESDIARSLFAYKGRAPGPGHYTRLVRKGVHYPMMSDTAAEQRDHYAFLGIAEGDVLIVGLGLGVLIELIKQHETVNEKVRSITVIDNSPDVVKLVGPHYEQKYGVKVIEADAFTYDPEQQFSCIWFDIWPEICEDNADEYDKLEERWRPFCRGGMGFWCDEMVRPDRFPWFCWECGLGDEDGVEEYGEDMCYDCYREQYDDEEE